MSARRTIFLIVLLTYLVSLSAIFYTEKASDKTPYSVFLSRRIKHLLEGTDEISKDPSHTLLFWGTSEVESFMDPVLFEQSLSQNQSPLTVYNLGMRSLPMPLLVDLARNFHLRQKPGAPKFKFSVLSVQPSRMTKVFLKDVEGYNLAQMKAAALSFSQIFDLGKSDPLSMLHILGIKTLLFGGAYSSVYEVIQTRFNDLFSLQAETQSVRSYFAMWKAKEFYETPEYRLEQKGLYQFNKPESQALFDDLARRKKSPEWNYQVAKLYYVRYLGIDRLDFSPEYVQELLKLIEELKSLSENVLVIFVPGSPIFQNFQLPQAQESTRQLMSRISALGGVEIVPLQNNAIPPEDFFDLVHPSQKGWEPVFEILSKRIHQLNKEDPLAH